MPLRAIKEKIFFSNWLNKKRKEYSERRRQSIPRLCPQNALCTQRNTQKRTKKPGIVEEKSQSRKKNKVEKKEKKRQKDGGRVATAVAPNSKERRRNQREQKKKNRRE